MQHPPEAVVNLPLRDFDEKWKRALFRLLRKVYFSRSRNSRVIRNITKISDKHLQNRITQKLYYR